MFRRSLPDKLRVRALDEPVSEFTTLRLSVYLRCLDLLEARGVTTVSSNEIAAQLGLNAAQIRKDLSRFGELGVRGVGYSVAELRRELREILGLDRQLNVAIVGAGNLGRALADYAGFSRDGFRVIGLFDVDPKKVGDRSRSGISIRSMEDLARIVTRDNVAIAVIAVPAAAAQEVADLLVASGVRAILNFSPVAVRVPEHVKLKNTDLSVLLESLSFFLAHAHEQAG